MAAPVHFLAHGRGPSCGQVAVRVTPSFWEVTCPDCLVGLPLALAQFRLAYAQLYRALVHSLWPRRHR